MSKVDFIIVNWNSGSQLLECVCSIFEFATDLLGQVIVVDNGSTDNSLEELPKEDARFKLILAKQNLGFAKACNLGAKYSSAEYLLFFNPDAKLMAETLPRVVGFMESPDSEKIGICGVKIIDEKAEVQCECAKFPSWKTYLWKALTLDRIFPKYFSTIWMSDFDHLTDKFVDHVMGCFFFIRSTIFFRVNGYDERFFVYFEDLDLSLRVKQAGYESFYLSNAIIYHKGGGVSEQVKAHRLFYSLRSRILYAFKHFSVIKAIMVIICAGIEIMPRLAAVCAKGSFQEFLDTIKGYMMLYKDFPQILKIARGSR